MRKLSLLPVIFLFWSCQKFIDKYHFDPSDKLCKLNSISTTTRYDAYRKNFYNNKWGNPDSIIYDDPGTGHGSKYLVYDKNQRLIRQIDGDNGAYRYVYAGASKWPVRDTLLDYYGSVYVEKFTYDNKDRIIRVEVKWLYSSHPEVTGTDSHLEYIYNSQGNLFDQHDDKINYLRTSKVLQFLYRDYSMNNAYVALRYNQYGFPEKFDYSALPGTVDVLSEEIAYTCKDEQELKD